MTPFCPNLGKNKFPWKKRLWEFLNTPIIHYRAKKSEKTNEPSFLRKMPNWWTDRRTDRRHKINSKKSQATVLVHELIPFFDSSRGKLYCYIHVIMSSYLKLFSNYSPPEKLWYLLDILITSIATNYLIFMWCHNKHFTFKYDLFLIKKQFFLHNTQPANTCPK